MADISSLPEVQTAPDFIIRSVLGATQCRDKTVEKRTCMADADSDTTPHGTFWYAPRRSYSVCKLFAEHVRAGAPQINEV